MGRKTFEYLISFNLDWPYMDFYTYIVTSNMNFQVNSPRTKIFTSNIQSFLEKKKNFYIKDIWIVDGGALLSNKILLTK